MIKIITKKSVVFILMIFLTISIYSNNNNYTLYKNTLSPVSFFISTPTASLAAINLKTSLGKIKITRNFIMKQLSAKYNFQGNDLSIVKAKVVSKSDTQVTLTLKLNINNKLTSLRLILNLDQIKKRLKTKKYDTTITGLTMENPELNKTSIKDTLNNQENDAKELENDVSNSQSNPKYYTFTENFSNAVNVTADNFADRLSSWNIQLRNEDIEKGKQILGTIKDKLNILDAILEKRHGTNRRNGMNGVVVRNDCNVRNGYINDWLKEILGKENVFFLSNGLSANHFYTIFKINDQWFSIDGAADQFEPEETLSDNIGLVVMPFASGELKSSAEGLIIENPNKSWAFNTNLLVMGEYSPLYGYEIGNNIFSSRDGIHAKQYEQCLENIDFEIFDNKKEIELKKTIDFKKYQLAFTNLYTSLVSQKISRNKIEQIINSFTTEFNKLDQDIIGKIILYSFTKSQRLKNTRKKLARINFLNTLFDALLIISKDKQSLTSINLDLLSKSQAFQIAA